jgi:hypothetical protein
VPPAPPIGLYTSLLSGWVDPRVAPTFGRLCNTIRLSLARPNVGAAEPHEAKHVNLWRERTDNRPWQRIEVVTHVRPTVGATHLPEPCTAMLFVAATIGLALVRRQSNQV